jgi:endoplasmic reticulum Man9GlcNAc2 1,2-alpha-mannosidase
MVWAWTQLFFCSFVSCIELFTILEYLGKQYLLTKGKEPAFQKLYNGAVAGIKKHLLNRSAVSKLLYIQELPSGFSKP